MRKIKLLFYVICILTMMQCGSPISPREQCYKEEFCETAGGDCLIGTLFITSLFSPSSGSSSSSNVGTTSSEFESNDNFVNSSFLFPSNTSLFTGRAGTISSASDVDIYVVSFTSSSGPSTRALYLSKVSGAATCNAYARSSQTFAANNTIDGTFTSLGALTSSTRTITQNLSDSSFIYILCSGNSGDTYEIRAGIDLANSNSSSLTSLSNILLLSCVDAKRSCIAYCDSKHAF